MLLQTLTNSPEIQANFTRLIDIVSHEHSILSKVSRDAVSAISNILSVYQLTFEFEVDEDGWYAGSIEQISDIVADGENIEELRYNLAAHLLEYAKDYLLDFNRYYFSTNRGSHAVYILRVLLEDNIQGISKMLKE